MVTLFLLFMAQLLQQGEWNVDRRGVAIAGYDPVSYFQGAPQEGSSEFIFTYEGAQFYFTSKDNMSHFKAKPQHYVPQFGGWCAFAMGDSGEKVSVDPKTYKITEGKLYLFFNSRGNNTLNSWNADEPELRQRARRNWDKLYAADL